LALSSFPGFSRFLGKPPLNWFLRRLQNFEFGSGQFLASVSTSDALYKVVELAQAVALFGSGKGLEDQMKLEEYAAMK